MLKGAFAWALAWLFAAAFYLLLIDITDLPELIVGAVAAVLAATGFEFAREQHIATEAVRPVWFARVYRPVLRVPVDLALLVVAALRQLARPQAARGEFRTVRFRTGGEDDARATGRRALAEAFGSFSPNTIVVGIDGDRELILAHQLRPSGGDEAVDVLGLR